MERGRRGREGGERGERKGMERGRQKTLSAHLFSVQFNEGWNLPEHNDLILIGYWYIVHYLSVVPTGKGGLGGERWSSDTLVFYREEHAAGVLGKSINVLFTI